jgi:hypothetical protein
VDFRVALAPHRVEPTADRRDGKLGGVPTGEPYAGKPPVRFGARGRRKPIPTPITLRRPNCAAGHIGFELVLMFPGHLMEACVLSCPIFFVNSSRHFGHLNGQRSSSSYTRRSPVTGPGRRRKMADPRCLGRDFRMCVCRLGERWPGNRRKPRQAAALLRKSSARHAYAMRA